MTLSKGMRACFSSVKLAKRVRAESNDGAESICKMKSKRIPYATDGCAALVVVLAHSSARPEGAVTPVHLSFSPLYRGRRGRPSLSDIPAYNHRAEEASILDGLAQISEVSVGKRRLQDIGSCASARLRTATEAKPNVMSASPYTASSRAVP